jgi:hypothetical protein
MRLQEVPVRASQSLKRKTQPRQEEKCGLASRTIQKTYCRVVGGKQSKRYKNGTVIGGKYDAEESDERNEAESEHEITYDGDDRTCQQNPQ